MLPNRRFNGFGNALRGWGYRRNDKYPHTGGGPQAYFPSPWRSGDEPVSKPAPYSVLGKVSAPLGSRGGRVLLRQSCPLLPEDTGTWAEGGQGGGSTSAQPVWSISDNERSVQRAERAWQRPGSSWGQAQLPAPTPDKERPGPGELAAFPPLGAPWGGLSGGEGGGFV